MLKETYKPVINVKFIQIFQVLHILEDVDFPIALFQSPNTLFTSTKLKTLSLLKILKSLRHWTACNVILDKVISSADFFYFFLQLVQFELYQGWELRSFVETPEALKFLQYSTVPYIFALVAIHTKKRDNLV